MIEQSKFDDYYDNEDDYSDDSLFNIASWGADLSFRELVMMYEDDELVKPELQRKYVWDKTEASRFIESILLGLPIPNIFLAKNGSQKLIVDGYQRIMTVYDYMRGVFSGETSSDSKSKVFKLSNSEKINHRWRNKAFVDLNRDEQIRIKSTTIHAIMFEQKKPENDDTSMYQIFERINTTGRTLTPQEIRNCVYQGSLNKLLFELNKNKTWRKLFGSQTEDSRMRDIECILRFFVLKTDNILKSDSSQISLKKSLNKFMGEYQNCNDDLISSFKKEFEETIVKVDEIIGCNAFKNYSSNKFSSKFHPVIYDAIMIAIFFANKRNLPLSSITPEQHIALLQNEEFKEAISNRTTNVESIRKRIGIVSQQLLGVDFDDR